MTALKPLGRQNDALMHQPLGLTNLSLGRRSPLGISAATLSQTFPVMQLSLQQVDRFSQDPTFYDEFDFTSAAVNAGTEGSSAPPASPAPTQDFAPATPPIQAPSEPIAPTPPPIPPTATPSTAEITEILSPSITRLPLAPPDPLGNRLPLTLPEPITPDSAEGSDQVEEPLTPLSTSSEPPTQFDPIQRSLTADRSDDLPDVTASPLPTAAIASESVEQPAAPSAPPALNPQTASTPPLQLEAITAEAVDQLADEPVDQSVNIPGEPTTLTTSATQVSATETPPIARSPAVMPPEIAVSSPEALPAVSAASGPTEPLQPIVEPRVAEQPRPSTPGIQTQGEVAASTERRAPEARILHDEITAAPTKAAPTVHGLATSPTPIVSADSPVHVTRLPAPLDTTPDAIQPSSGPEPRLEHTSGTPTITPSADLPGQLETLPATDADNQSQINRLPDSSPRSDELATANHPVLAASEPQATLTQPEIQLTTVSPEWPAPGQLNAPPDLNTVQADPAAIGESVNGISPTIHPEPENSVNLARLDPLPQSNQASDQAPMPTERGQESATDPVIAPSSDISRLDQPANVPDAIAHQPTPTPEPTSPAAFQTLPPLVQRQPLTPPPSLVTPPLGEPQSTDLSATAPADRPSAPPDIVPPSDPIVSPTPTADLGSAMPDTWSSLADLLQRSSFDREAPDRETTEPETTGVEPRSWQDLAASLSDNITQSPPVANSDANSEQQAPDQNMVTTISASPSTLVSPRALETPPESTGSATAQDAVSDEQLAQLTWQVYSQLRCRFEIDHERYGRALQSYPPWLAVPLIDPSHTPSPQKPSSPPLTNAIEQIAPTNAKLAQLVGEVYYRVRSRFAIEQERCGITHRNHH